MRAMKRIALPVIQVVIAIILIISNRMRPLSGEKPAWTAPDKQFCDGVNAPAALVRFLVTRVADTVFPQYYRVEIVLETVVFLVLVGLLWYAVTIEIQGNGESILTARTQMRRTADVVIMLFGALLGIIGLVVRGQFGAVTLYSNFVAVPYYLWAFLIIGFYGHDLWVSSKPQPDMLAGLRAVRFRMHRR